MTPTWPVTFYMWAQQKLVLWCGGTNLFCDLERINTTNLNRVDRINVATPDSM